MYDQIFYILHWIKNLSMFEQMMMMMRDGEGADVGGKDDDKR